MAPSASRALRAQAARWEDLTRWQRAELGRALRRLGWSYGEIRRLIPVPKGTLSRWCRDIRLSDDQAAAIKERTGSARGVPRDTQRKRRAEIDAMKAAARDYARARIDDPLFVAGTVLYWAEGAKTGIELSLANSDPRALRLFIRWVRAYHDCGARFVLRLHLHAGNDDALAQHFWAQATGLTNAEFYRSFIKPPGTGHRKNHLPQGVCTVRVRRAADARHRTDAWIEVVSEILTSPRLLTSSPGR